MSVKQLKDTVMKIRNALILSLGMSLSGLSYANTADVNQARDLVKEFAGQLQPALGAAMKAGGPVNALGVCQTKAPEIAQSLSDRSGWDVKRVSLKNRSADAEPDSWEIKVLKRFDQERAEGADPAAMEYSEVVQDKGQKTFRYMKAIAIGEGQPCLHCHGVNLNADVKKRLGELYPHDKATGYQVGQVRGAFSFQKHL